MTHPKRNRNYQRDAILDDLVFLRENGYARASNRELAERLGISKKSLENHLARARAEGDQRAPYVRPDLVA